MIGSISSKGTQRSFRSHDREQDLWAGGHGWKQADAAGPRRWERHTAAILQTNERQPGYRQRG